MTYWLIHIHSIHKYTPDNAILPWTALQHLYCSYTPTHSYIHKHMYTSESTHAPKRLKKIIERDATQFTNSLSGKETEHCECTHYFPYTWLCWFSYCSVRKYHTFVSLSHGTSGLARHNRHLMLMSIRNSPLLSTCCLKLSFFFHLCFFFNVTSVFGLKWLYYLQLIHFVLQWSNNLTYWFVLVLKTKINFKMFVILAAIFLFTHRLCHTRIHIHT